MGISLPKARLEVDAASTTAGAVYATCYDAQRCATGPEAAAASIGHFNVAVKCPHGKHCAKTKKQLVRNITGILWLYTGIYRAG